ncbi:histidine kinase [Pedobacter duraquae]|uniref:Histidine kinase n=1 Tax=Pedobacter duraquae TaxID=425511 RepID=A0A4R6IQ56_9SPHI|nr:sensor histidine kinase [Pedobacter duraquae]TDO24449.1 histidine kinase [Pedobacter duraquae]
MRLTLYLLISLGFAFYTPAVNYEQSEVVYRTGDSLKWAQPNYKSAGWRTDRGLTRDSVFWVRIPVQISGLNTETLGMIVFAFGAHEVYWDGVRIGKNGNLAMKGLPESPGTEYHTYMVPDSLSQNGNHVIAIRATQAHKQTTQRGFDIKLDSYKNLERVPLIIMSFMNLMAGAFFIAALYYFLLYMNSNKKDLSILVFGVVCLLFFTLLILEFVKFYVDIPYTKFYLRLEFIGWITFAIAILVPFYFTIQFNLKHRLLIICILLIALLAVYWYNFRHYDITAMYLSYTMWATTVLIVLNAIRKKEIGGLIVLSGLIASAVVNYFLVYDFGLFISFTIIVICMLYLHTVKTREAEKAHDAAIQLSSRLQLELIKKNIQPHFIKNTLTSLIDWVEESPAQGAVFLQALAEEFDLFNTISDQTLIPLQTEIDLCKTHLRLMSFRKEINYDWQESGIDPHDLIPPAIIHTLLENGITHSAPDTSHTVAFKLNYQKTLNSRIYSLETIARNREKTITSNRGTGFKYVAARLEESYGKNWDFQSGATKTGWLNTITIYT